MFACGQNFSIFYTENNELYAVGSNADGRCGISHNGGSATPTLAEFPKTKVIKSIACGNNHSLVLTTEGHVYSTGMNDQG